MDGCFLTSSNYNDCRAMGLHQAFGPTAGRKTNSLLCSPMAAERSRSPLGLDDHWFPAKKKTSPVTDRNQTFKASSRKHNPTKQRGLGTQTTSLLHRDQERTGTVVIFFPVHTELTNVAKWPNVPKSAPRLDDVMSS